MSKFTNLNKDKVVLIGSSKYRFLTEDNLKVGADLGNVAYQYNRVSATSGGSGKLSGTVVFKASMGSGMVTSVPRLECRLPVEFEATADGAKTWQAFAAELDGKVGLACYPYAKAISSGTVKFDSGQGITSRPSQNYQVIVNSMDPYKLALATDAPGVDQYSKYEISSINNPLASGSNIVQMYKARGFGCNYKVEASNGVNGKDAGEGGVPEATKAKVTITFVWSDAIPLDPCQYRDVGNAQPFYNLDDLEFTLDIKNIFENCFACDGTYNSTTRTYTGPGYTAKAVEDGVSHKFLYQLWKPSFKLTVPKQLAYASTQVDLAFDGKPVDVDAGATVQFTNDVDLRLSQVPKMFAVMVNRPSKPGQPLTRLPIQKISIDTAGTNDLLNNAHQDDLYAISSKNGSVLRYASFVAASSSSAVPLNNDAAIGCGSIFYVKPSDMGLQDTIIGGSLQTFNFKVRVDVKSVSTASEKCALQIFAMYDAVCVADETEGYNMNRVSIGDMGAIDAKVVNMVDDSSKMNHVIGGNFWGDLWSGIKNIATSQLFKKAVRLGRNNLPYVSDFARDGTTLGNVASAMGYGAKGKAKASRAKPRAKPRSKAKGGDIYRVGGGEHTEADLDAMLDM